MRGFDLLDSLIALYMIRIRSQNSSKDFCITSSTSIWLWYSAGYNGFGIDCMCMTTEDMEVQPVRGTRDS